MQYMQNSEWIYSNRSWRKNRIFSDQIIHSRVW